MLLENYIKLLLEAPQIKLGDLMKHQGKVLVGKNYQSYWEFANVEFKSFHANEDLSKRGPFFNCMKLCFDEFLSYENDPAFDIAENLRAMIVYINGLYDFKNNPEVNKVYTAFIADGYNGFEELKGAYENIFQHIGPKNLNSFGNPNYLSLLKTSQTEYLFDTSDRTMNGVLAVVPTTTASSIFWARTNAAAQQIILTKLNRGDYENDRDFLTWCTSFPDDSNMFHSYYVNGGTSLFYFLPINDMQGLNKFCIGITKVKDPNHPDKFRLLCGGHTTVGFENRAFIEDGSDFQDERIKDMMLDKFGTSGLTMEMLQIIEEKVSGRNPFDKYAYVGNLKPAEFAASINMNTIGSTEDGRKTIKRQIETILSTYEEPEFLKNYQPNPKIIQVVNKDIRYWTECNVDIKLIPEKFADASDFWLNNTLKNSEEDVGYSESGMSIENFIDWNFKKRPNIVTADFVIDFIEKCFDRSVQEGKYNPDDTDTRFDRFNQTASEDGESDAYFKEYRSPYDKIALNLKMSLVPLEALMKWSSSDLTKFFQYIQKVKSNYPAHIIDINNMYKNDSKVNEYFLRRIIPKKVNQWGEEDDNYKYSNYEYRNIKMFSSRLLEILFNNFNDFKHFCDTEGRFEILSRGRDRNLMFYVTDFLLFDNSKLALFKPFLIPNSWLSPDVIKKYVLSENDSVYVSRANQIIDMLRQNPEDEDNQDIVIQDINQFKKDNHQIVIKVIPKILRTEIEEIFEEYEISGDINQVLYSHAMKFVEDLLEEHADIIQELQATELNDPNSNFAKFSNLYAKIGEFKNRGLNVSDNFNSFITEAAKHCRHLIDNEPKGVGEFIIDFLDKLKKRLENNSGNLSTFENSFFMASEFKKYDVAILNFGQYYFWNFSLDSDDTVIKDPHSWARFFYEIYEGNAYFSLLNVSAGYDFEIQNAIGVLRRLKNFPMSAIEELERKVIISKNLNAFVHCEMFKGIMSNFNSFVTDDEGKEFFTIMMQKLYYDYFNSDSNSFIKFCLVFFKDNPYNHQNKYLSILTKNFLDDRSDDGNEGMMFKNSDMQKGIDETMKNREEKRRKARDEMLEKRQLERLARGEDEDDYYDDDDDNLDEAIKFKIGQKILTESQLRYLIRNLL